MVRRQIIDDPRRSVGFLIHSIGLREPTSLAEAQAAAHIDGQLRRIGLRVSADTFRAPVDAGHSGTLLALTGLLAAGLTDLLTLPALLLALWGAVLAVALLTRNVRPLFARSGDSQNVVATRASEKHPRWRVVLLARLDSPEVTEGVRWIAGMGRFGMWGRGVALAVIATLAAIYLFDNQPLWWYLQAIPSAYLLLTLFMNALPRRFPENVAGTGALAVLLNAAQQLSNLRQIELWAVALGATTSGGGVADLLKRYPFPQSETLVIALDQLDSGRLIYVTRERGLLAHQSDPYLRTLAANADAADPLIDAEPHLALHTPTLATPLLAKAYRTLTLSSYQPVRRPLRGRPEASPSSRPEASPSSDPLDALDTQLLDQATRLVVTMIRSLDS